jgi:hypothetical protein
VTDRGAVAKLLRDQGTICRVMGSALYGELLRRAGDDAEAGGPCWEMLREEADGESAAKAPALRLMAAVHRLVLEGKVPELARAYPSAGGNGDADEAWQAFLGLIRDRSGEVSPLLARRCQTNEVGRAAALIGGFLEVARHTGIPLRILEIGCSGGLNLRWDQYRYEADDAAWGPEHSPVVFAGSFEGRPPFDVAATVAERAGCDLFPVDPATDEGRLTLMSHVWPDQTERFRRLEGAIEIARRVPATVDRADAADWLIDRLRDASEGAATVVFHSVVMDQVDPPTRGRIGAAIEDAGARAIDGAPVAWLRMEHDYSYGLLRMTRPKVWLRVWPGGEDRLLARVGSHGLPVRWVA